MSRYVSLKEVHEKFTQTAGILAPLIKASLEVWLQAPDHFPNRAQQPPTECVMQSLQAAMRAAPWLTGLTGPQQERQLAAWLGEHLPRISTAMQDYLNSQLEFRTQRLGIIRSIRLSQAQPKQRRAMLMSEEHVMHMLDVLLLEFNAVLPVATLYHDLAVSHLETSDAAPTQHDQGQCKQRLKQGTKLISTVGLNLQAAKQVSVQLQPIGTELVQLGMSSTQGKDEIRHMHAARQGHAFVGWAFLRLVVQLSPGAEDAINFLTHVHWQLFDQYTLRNSLNDFKPLLCVVLARPRLLSAIKALKTELGPFGMYSLLLMAEIDAEQLQAAGMPEAVARQLLSMKRGIDSDASSSVSDTATESDSDTDSDSDAQPDPWLSADSDLETGVVAGEDLGNLNDMNMLVRQMYGGVNETGTRIAGSGNSGHKRQDDLGRWSMLGLLDNPLMRRHCPPALLVPL